MAAWLRWCFVVGRALCREILTIRTRSQDQLSLCELNLPFLLRFGMIQEASVWPIAKILDAHSGDCMPPFTMGLTPKNPVLEPYPSGCHPRY